MNKFQVPKTPLAAVLPDPGNAGNIDLGINYNVIVPLTTAGAETRTLLAPSSLGQRVTIFQDTYVGAATLTVNSPVTGLTTLVIGQYDFVVLESVSVAGAIKWTVRSAPKSAAPTTALTALTIANDHTTPDYLIQAVVDSGVGSAWGLASENEAITLLYVVANLQTRMAEVVATLQAAKLMT